jgi:pimeloyl-ACP methyl ester carboxylesterase
VWDVVGDDPAGPAVILCHGWGDSRIGGLSRLPAVAPCASRLILWDMPGHGEARGRCSLGTREVGALLGLIEQVGGPVVLVGWSLGAGIAVAAAAGDDRVLAVVAEAPYRLPWTPARNVLRAFGLPWRVSLPCAMALLGTRFGVGPLWRGFDRAALAGKVRQPLLVIHGADDDVCPLEDGRDIAGAAPQGVFLPIPNAGHHGLWTAESTAVQCRAAVREFLSRALNSGHALQSNS